MCWNNARRKALEPRTVGMSHFTVSCTMWHVQTFSHWSRTFLKNSEFEGGHGVWTIILFFPLLPWGRNDTFDVEDERFHGLSHGNEWCSFAWCGKADERIDCVCLVCFGQTVREHQILDQKEIGMCWKWDTAIGRMWVTNRRQRRFWWGTETIFMEISWKFAFVMVECSSMAHLPLFPMFCQWFESECSDSLVNWIFDGAVSHEECWMEKVFCTMCIQHCASLCSHMWLKWVRIVTFEQILFAHQSVSGGILEKRIGIIFWFLLWKISKHGIACACWVDAPNWQCALPQSVLHCTLSHWCPLSWHIELHCGSLSSVEAQCIEMWWQMKNKNTKICNPLRNNACPHKARRRDWWGHDPCHFHQQCSRLYVDRHDAPPVHAGRASLVLHTRIKLLNTVRKFILCSFVLAPPRSRSMEEKFRINNKRQPKQQQPKTTTKDNANERSYDLPTRTWINQYIHTTMAPGSSSSSSSNKQRDYDYLFKLVLIGDSGVGKSCLLLRFAVRVCLWFDLPFFSSLSLLLIVILLLLLL